jgi:hypothetical protein
VNHVDMKEDVNMIDLREGEEAETLTRDIDTQVTTLPLTVELQETGGMIEVMIITIDQIPTLQREKEE